MESKTKAPEGIALLSMYNDEDDEEMEDTELVDVKNGEEKAKDAMEEDSAAGANEDTLPLPRENSIPSQQPSVSVTSPQQPQAVPIEAKRSGRGKLTIVDYGQDEVALSPEIEGGETGGVDQVMLGMEHHTLNDMEPSRPNEMEHAAGASEAIEVERPVINSTEDVDLLDKFLPPPPEAICSEELQMKINKFINLKRIGKSFNAEVRNRKDYRNPDFLVHAVRYQDIDPFGSNFNKDVFDPHGYDKSDFIDEIEADMRRERERERPKNQRLDLVSAKARVDAAAGRANSAPTAADNVPRDGRSKKSKWDEVDGAQRNPLPTGGQSLPSVGAHTALPPTNARSGYTAFAQQRRREAEEKRSSGKKLDRRS